MKFFVLIVLLMPLPSFAQTTKIRSGEHTGFTRLVIPLNGAADWRFGRGSTGYELQIKEESLALDLSEVYARITRNRIRSVQGISGSHIVIHTACICHADVFETSEDLLVVDIKDGAPFVRSPFEKPFRSVSLADQNGSFDQFRFFWRQYGRSHAVNLESKGGPDNTAFNTTPVHEPTLVKKHNIEREVTKAVSYGLLQSSIPYERIVHHIGRSDLPYKVSNSFDPYQATSVHRADVQKSCPGSQEFDLRSWGDDRSITSQLADATSYLYVDGSEKVEGSLALVRLFIRYGFGAEAALLLSEFPDIPNANLLTMFANIIAGEQEPIDVKAISNCPGDEAVLWSVLADDSMELTASEEEAVARAFYELPSELRSLFKDLLQERIASSESAARFMFGRELVPTSQRLPKDPQSTNATNFHVAEKVIIAGDSLAFEHRRTTAEGEHLAQKIERLMSLGAYREAVLELRKGDEIPDDRLKMIARTILDFASDVDFARYSLDPNRRIGDPDIERGILERLKSLGFAAQSERQESSFGELEERESVGTELRTPAEASQSSDFLMTGSDLASDQVAGNAGGGGGALTTTLRDGEDYVSNSRVIRGRTDQILSLQIPAP